MEGFFRRKKDIGSVGDLMVTCIFVLSMSVIMLAFTEYMSLIRQKTEVGQLARRYILRMEASGGLESEDRAELNRELDTLGVSAVTIEGTNVGEAHYGEKIYLEIRGTLGGKYEICEKRVSTAKH